MKAKKAISVILIILFSLPLICNPSMVYANNKLEIAEYNGQCNCGEGEFWENNFPSLSIESIECSPDNKLSIIVGLYPAYQPGGTWQNYWEAEGEVYFDGEKMGIFDIKNPVYPEHGIDFYSHGSYTYLLSWEITSPVIVRVGIHATVIIENNDLRSYYYRDVFGQELVEPLGNTSTTLGNISTNGAKYLPLLLGLIGLSIVLWIGYQRYGTRWFRHGH